MRNVYEELRKRVPVNGLFKAEFIREHTFEVVRTLDVHIRLYIEASSLVRLCSQSRQARENSKHAIVLLKPLIITSRV